MAVLTGKTVKKITFLLVIYEPPSFMVIKGLPFSLELGKTDYNFLRVFGKITGSWKTFE